MNRLEHLDKGLVDELAHAAREAVREELKEQTRKQRRTAALYAAAGAVGLYAGAALALAVGLALALGLPDWAAALITAVMLGGVAYLLRGAARPSAARPSAAHPSAARPSASPLTPERPVVPPTVEATRPGGVDPEAPNR